MKYAIILLLLLTACTNMVEQSPNPIDDLDTITPPEPTEPEPLNTPEKDQQPMKAYFAGGCFWCMEAAYEALDGVTEVVSGYSGGQTENPTYKEVTYGSTGHKEAVEVQYNPNIISYKELVDYFWRQINPTDAGGQFADRGDSYTTAIFYQNAKEKKIAEDSRKEIQKMFDEPIATEILPLNNFYEAEEYHQDYYKKRTASYKIYEQGSGRPKYKQEVWEKMDEEELKKKLTPEQYHITQEDGTEKPFDNEYWDNTKPGIYVDLISGEPLFSSKDKFKSGTGWPSFTKPLEEKNIVKKEDRKLLIKRTEIRSKQGDAHLGHLFNDGPEPTGLRYCMNSAALKFIPKEDLQKEGYEQYVESFDQ